MKLTYLGTSAAEGFPALFCNCKNCRAAKELGGKNIRTRSQSIINDDLLIDFPPDTHYHFFHNKIEADKIKYLIITHGHVDHFYQSDLMRKRHPNAWEMREPTLHLACSATIAQGLDLTDKNIELTVIKAFDTIQLGDYSITALPARVMPNGEPFIYIIKSEGRTLLYGNDTGYFYDSVFEYIEDNGIVFDMVSLDCTNIEFPIEDTRGHMGFPNIERVLARLSDIGAITDATKKYLNHFSHKGNALQDALEEQAKPYGCRIAYDGCSVEI